MRFSKPVLTAILCISAVAPQNTRAEPTLYPPDAQVLSSVRNPTDSNLLADELDPRTIWVMPPNTASAIVTGLHSKTANMGFCASMKDQQEFTRDLSRQIKALYDRKMARQEEFLALRRRADLANEEAERFAIEKSMQAVLNLDNAIRALEERQSLLQEQYDKCPRDCDGIQQEMQLNLQAKQEMLRQRLQLSKKYANDFREYEKRARAALAMEKTYQNAKKIYAEMARELADLRSSFLEQFSAFGKMGGAKANFRYSSGWASNIATLRKENPGINFKKLATKSAILHAEIAGVDNIDPTGAVLAIYLADGLKDGVVKLNAYPENLNIDVGLSLLGACPMEHPEYFDLQDNDVSRMKYGLIISYEYDSIFHVKASAQYNLYKMYQKIVSSGSSGGLFSSRSWSTVEEKNYFRDSFRVVWDDKENSLSPEQKEARETEMRRNVMLRLAALALPQTPGAAEIIAAAAPPAHGAIIVADELMKNCSGNAYCQGASVVFRVLDAIFGSSSSTANYTNITDLELKEDFQSTGKITKPWITSYL